jgi:hypothetical protein
MLVMRGNVLPRYDHAQRVAEEPDMLEVMPKGGDFGGHDLIDQSSTPCQLQTAPPPLGHRGVAALTSCGGTGMLALPMGM